MGGLFIRLAVINGTFAIISLIKYFTGGMLENLAMFFFDGFATSVSMLFYFLEKEIKYNNKKRG